MQTDIIGPITQGPRWDIAAGGVVLPHVIGNPSDEDGKLFLEVDGVLFGPWTHDEIRAIAPLLGRAMAVAAGYTHHGEGARRRNPHAYPVVGRLEPDEVAASRRSTLRVVDDASEGRRFRAARTAAGMTMGALADRLGVSVEHVSALERGIEQPRYGWSALWDEVAQWGIRR